MHIAWDINNLQHQILFAKYSIKGDCAGNKNESYVYIHHIP